MAATTKKKSVENKPRSEWDSPATLEFLTSRYLRMIPKHKHFYRLDVRPLWSQNGVHRYRLCYYVLENTPTSIVDRLKMLRSYFVVVDEQYKPLSANPAI